MVPFIESVISDLLKNKIEFSSATIVFPSKRPILFFKNTLKKLGYKGIIPKLITIEEWIAEITGATALSGINLWLTFYTVYISTVEEPKNFEDFIKWAPTILNDFNDLDKSLANIDAFFYGMVSVERIEKWGLQDWEKDTSIKQHLFFWKEMEQVYKELNQHFKDTKKGYDGFLYKEALSALPNYLQQTKETLYFLGFNALTPVEEKIITHCLDQNKAIIYWETDEYYLNDKTQEAGDFFRKYKKWNYHQKNDFSFVVNNFKEKKEIKTYAVPTNINQAKLIGDLIGTLTPLELEKTTVVLADENLLTPLLNSLPESVTTTNITMGLGLKYIPLSFFFDYCISLHLNKVDKKYNQNKFYYVDIFNLLESSFLPKDNAIIECIQFLKKYNYSFISPDLILSKLENTAFKILFQEFSTTKEFLQAIIKWIDFILEEFEKELSEINLEALIHFHQIFTKLLNEINEYKIEINFNSLHYLYNTLKNLEKLSFVGEPLSGLQIVGMLETRLLNYDKIIVANVNEGAISPGNLPNSLIPYDIRKNFNLITYTDRDAIYAYHFYRLLQNAKDISLIYTTSSSGINMQEKSRFITQLEIESPHNIQHIQASTNVKIRKEDAIEIIKTPHVIEKIKTLFKQGISPSSLNAYIRNPMDFYFSKILGIYPAEELEADIAHKTIGTVVHESLKELYLPFLNKILTTQDFIKIEKQLIETVNRNFKAIYKEGDFTSGKNHLIYSVITKMVERIIFIDKEIVANKNELIISDLELKLQASFITESKETINFIGTVDRVDTLNGNTRILDYKTGVVKSSSLSVTTQNISSFIKKPDYDKALQLSLYSYLYLENNPKVSSILSGIYSVRNAKSGFMALNYEKQETIDNAILSILMKPIEDIIMEILDPAIPFIKKEIAFYGN